MSMAEVAVLLESNAEEGCQEAATASKRTWANRTTGLKVAAITLVGAVALSLLFSQVVPQSLHSRARSVVGLAVVDARRISGKDLRLTEKEYSDSDHAQACAEEYGPSYRTADWAYDLLDLDEKQITGMCGALGIRASFNKKYYFVTNEGDTFWDGSKRAFFFERHDGEVPSNWLVHDRHGAITLGSWMEIKGPVLCAAGSTENAEDASSQVQWTRYTETFLNLYAGGVSEVMALESAKSKCIELGPACFGVTCGHDANFGTGRKGMAVPEESCTVRAGLCAAHALYACPPNKRRGVQPSPTHEVSYVKEVADSTS